MRKSTKKYAGNRRSGWRTAGNVILWILTAIAIVGLIAACFGGYANPHKFKGLSLFQLTMPAWLIGWLIIMVLDFFWNRKALFVSIIGFIPCVTAVWDYCPLNVFGPSAKKYAGCPKFTLLTYNVASFHNMTGEYPGDVNPTVSYIIRQNADIVCLQETEVTLSGPFERFHVTAQQIDTISGMYPYRFLYGGYLTVLSKYPVEPIHTPPLNNNQKQKWSIYPIGVFRVNIEGVPVTLFNVHLQSYSLSASDKALYKNIAEGKEIAEVAEGSVQGSIGEIKRQIYNKVQRAAEHRANEADALCRYIEKFGGPNVIVAGDFNDVPGCYTLRRLEEYDLKQVYPELGFGPMITFNADMFYFRIDHILYRGDFVPLSIRRGNIKSSDHYPLTATFAIKPSDKK